jgi:hypothetical protein
MLQQRHAHRQHLPRRGRRRRLLFGAAIFLLVLCLVGSVAGYVWYGRKTRIDRSTPVAVVSQFVDAIFTYRDPVRTERFECDGTDPSGPLLEQLRLMEDRERQFNIIFIITAQNFLTEEIGTKARVRAEIQFVAPTGNAGLATLIQPWVFELEDDDGWRVCKATKQEP